jgi:hypothetical protein
MTPAQRQAVAQAIDPEAWAADDRRAAYYRRRRAASMAAADRVTEAIRQMLSGGMDEVVA